MRFANSFAMELHCNPRKSLRGKYLRFAQNLVKLVAMDKKQLLADLRAAKKTIDFAIQELAKVPDVPDPSAREKVGQCNWCGEAIFSDDGTQRGLHIACYNDAYKDVRSGKTTLEELEERGILEAKKQGGRPRTTRRAERVAALAKETSARAATDYAVDDTRKRSKKKKGS